MFYSQVCNHLRSTQYSASEADMQVGRNVEVERLTKISQDTNNIRITEIEMSDIQTHILSVK